MTPTLLFSGPCTVTVSLFSLVVQKILHESALLSGQLNHSELLQEAGGLFFDEQPLTGIVFGLDPFTKRFHSAFQILFWHQTLGHDWLICLIIFIIVKAGPIRRNRADSPDFPMHSLAENRSI